MKKHFLLLMVAAAALTFSFQACNNDPKTDSAEQAEEINEDNESLNSDASDFMIKAASGGMMEVELGNIAQQNAGSARVKAFGAMMVRDHSKANDELKALATVKNIAIPSTLSEEHQKHVDEMKNMSGADFDKRYMEMMVDDHKEDIGLFEEASNEDKDADIKAFAAKTLPVLKVHADSAKAVNDAVKK